MGIGEAIRRQGERNTQRPPKSVDDPRRTTQPGQNGAVQDHKKAAEKRAGDADAARRQQHHMDPSESNPGVRGHRHSATVNSDLPGMAEPGFQSRQSRGRDSFGL